MALEVIILAAGQGKRMKSKLPKVLHKVAGTPMLFHVIKTAYKLDPEAIHLVLGVGYDKVIDALEELPYELSQILHIARQEKQLGTANAVMAALDNVKEQNDILVLYGDTPLTPVEVLKDLLDASYAKDFALLTATIDDPSGYGRIIRDANNNVCAIVEEKDASDHQKEIREINTGMMAGKAQTFFNFLPKIGNNNAQGEYYLTDMVGLLNSANLPMAAVQAKDFALLSGVNSPLQLAQVERIYQKRAALKLLEDGVTLADPERLDIRGDLKCGQDVFIDVNVIIEGEVTLGDRVEIGAGCIIKDCSIEDDSIISPYTIMEGSKLHRSTTVGPFARLRKGNELKDNVHVGNFVEIKNSIIDEGSKMGHLSYIGDTDMGADVNIGAGTITCNYDGANKHRTLIGNNVFVGSDTQLVAPVTVEDGATIGAGTTVTKKVLRDSLVITRAPLRALGNYKRPTKKK